MQALQIMNRALLMLIDEYPMLYNAVKLLKPTAYGENPKSLLLCEQLALEGNISTDGKKLFYDEEKVIRSFEKKGYKEIETEILHVLFHCILGHLNEADLYKDKKLAWAVMDRQVCHMVHVLQISQWQFSNYAEKKMNEYLGDCFHMGCYYKAKSKAGILKNVLEDCKGLLSDHHEFWDKENGQIWSSLSLALMGETGNAEKLLDILEQGGFEKYKGTESGYGVEKVKAAAENQNSYYHVLMRFLRMQECQKELPDAIDPMLYQYGLELYGDIPLIEPPDAEEQLVLNTICVALDTSGSCSGEESHQFLRETKNVLQDLQRLYSECELYLFQCDSSIQQEEHFSSMNEIPWEELEERKMYGWGGTSFIPVFNRVNELMKKERKKIDCLIYFTDTYGDWPEEKPDYPVFFIVPDAVDTEGRKNYVENLPEWIEVIGLGG